MAARRFLSPHQQLWSMAALSCCATPQARCSWLTGSQLYVMHGATTMGKKLGCSSLRVRYLIRNCGKANRARDLHETQDLKDLSIHKKEFSNSLLILEQTTQLLARVGRGSTQRDRKQQALPRPTEARSRLCSGLSILHLAADTSSHYCPRKVLVRLLYKPWRRFSPSLLTLFMSHCWDILA